MKKLSYLFAVAASAACLCACTDVTDVLPAEQIPADARSTLGADVVLQWNNEEQTIDGFGVAQAGWSDYLYAHRKRQEIMDVMFGQDGLRLSILRGEVFPHYDETTFNMDEDINLSLDDPFSILISTVMRIVVCRRHRTAQRTVVDHEKSEAGIRCGQTHLFRLVCSGLYEKQRQYLARFFETPQLSAFADYLPISVMPTQRQVCLSMPSLRPTSRVCGKLELMPLASRYHYAGTVHCE